VTQNASLCIENQFWIWMLDIGIGMDRKQQKMRFFSSHQFPKKYLRNISINRWWIYYDAHAHAHAIALNINEKIPFNSKYIRHNLVMMFNNVSRLGTLANNFFRVLWTRHKLINVLVANCLICLIKFERFLFKFYYFDNKHFFVQSTAHDIESKFICSLTAALWMKKK